MEEPINTPLRFGDARSPDSLYELDAVYRAVCDKFKRMGEEGEQLDVYHIASFFKACQHCTASMRCL